MKINWGWVAAAVVFAILVYERQTKSTLEAAIDTLYVRDTVRVRDSVNVVKWVRLTARDTLNITDTVAVKEYLERVDTLREKCMACVASAAGVSQAAQQVVMAARPKFGDRFGISIGYGLTKVGSDVKAGPQIGVSLRIWP